MPPFKNSSQSSHFVLHGLCSLGCLPPLYVSMWVVRKICLKPCDLTYVRTLGAPCPDRSTCNPTPPLESCVWAHAVLNLTVVQSPSSLVLLLHAPLPLPEHWQERPEIELWPEDGEKDDLCRFMTLPEHKVGQALDARGTDQEVEWGVAVPAGEGVRGKSGRCDELGRGIDSL
jgi:hypothetical protein